MWKVIFINKTKSGEPFQTWNTHFIKEQDKCFGS